MITHAGQAGGALKWRTKFGFATIPRRQNLHGAFTTRMWNSLVNIDRVLSDVILRASQ